jgi:hypothetical protein
MDTDISFPAQRPQSQNAHGASKKSKLPRKRLLWVGAILIGLAVVLVWSWWLFGRSTAFNENKAVNPNEYQAIFLTNGQVYFGKLSDLNNKYVTVSDIYYLQVQQAQTTDGKNLQNASANTDTNAQVSLAKLGSELHGPEDKMHISSDQVLFWENLTNSGKVTQAINAYQKK